jgi:shikimate dehydrogenase
LLEFALIGKKLGHSFSEAYFNGKFNELKLDCSYKNQELESIEALPKLLSNSNIVGFNVTIPYKIEILPLLSSLTESAQAVGAVNTVYVDRSSKAMRLIGHNTDVAGFKGSIQKYLNLNSPTSALILGSGGAARAAVTGLQQLGITSHIVSRNPEKADYSYEFLNELDLTSFRVIINASPVGMYPEIDQTPLFPYEKLTENHLLFDMVYNPELTSFMKFGTKFNAKCVNGLEMLHLQADEAWLWWRSMNSSNKKPHSP